WETEKFYWKGEWMADVDVLAGKSGNLEVSITHSGSTNLEYLKIIIKSWGDGTVYMLFPEGGPWDNVRIRKDIESGYTINEAEFSNLGLIGEGTLTFEYLVTPICAFNYPVEVRVDFVLAEGIKRYKGTAYYAYDFCSG
ncbi:hypothetical protein, partial [Thermococcus sp. Bubb.Bath]|uniref:hypothetical protein n=2 Tax=Thermococcus TaxID=2263 RepID=UPI001981F49B